MQAASTGLIHRLHRNKLYRHRHCDAGGAAATKATCPDRAPVRRAVFAQGCRPSSSGVSVSFKRRWICPIVSIYNSSEDETCWAVRRQNHFTFLHCLGCKQKKPEQVPAC